MTVPRGTISFRKLPREFFLSAKSDFLLIRICRCVSDNETVYDIVALRSEMG